MDNIMYKEMQTFLEVRDKLNKPETRLEYNRCYKKPWRFYREHTADEAIAILKEEIEEMKAKVKAPKEV